MRPHATATPEKPTPRRPTAARLVVTGLLAVVLGACGTPEPTGPSTTGSPSSAEPESNGPPEPESQKPSAPPSGPAVGAALDEPGLVALESASQAGGTTDAPPVVIERLRDVADLTAGLDARLADAVRSRARALLPRVGDDLQLVGSVVWVGCEIPSDVRVVGAGDDVTLTPVVPDKGSVQCLVPVTTVALALASRG